METNEPTTNRFAILLEALPYDVQYAVEQGLISPDAINPLDYLEKSDVEYAQAHDLTLEDMVAFKREMEQEAEIERRAKIESRGRDAYLLMK